MSLHCPDCLTEIPARKRRQDARCDWCRSLVGGRKVYQPIRRRPVEPFEHLLSGLENPRVS